MQEFLNILELDAQEIEMKFKKSSIEGMSTSQEVSDFREQAVQEFVRKYYPFPYRISKGGIYDSLGQRSDSIDCIILNPNHPHTVNSSGKHSLIFADGVDAAIEVKPDLSSYKELERALKQGISIKNLKQINGPILLKETREEHIVELSKLIPYCIFTMKVKSNLEDTVKEIKKFYSDNSIPINQQLDFIVVLNKGIIINFKHKDFFCWGADNFDDIQKSGWFFEEWGKNSLAGFLLHLDRTYGASATMQPSYLTKYFQNYIKVNLTYI